MRIWLTIYCVYSQHRSPLTFGKSAFRVGSQGGDPRSCSYFDSPRANVPISRNPKATWECVHCNYSTITYTFKLSLCALRPSVFATRLDAGGLECFGLQAIGKTSRASPHLVGSKPTCSVSTSTIMSSSYPGSELTVEQLVHALAHALDPGSPFRRWAYL